MIKLLINNELKEVEFINFPAGESFCKLSPEDIKNANNTIYWIYEDDSEFFKLAQLKNILNYGYWNIIIPYLPHSRQDRKTTEYAPFSLKCCFDFLDNIFKGNINSNVFQYIDKNRRNNYRIYTFDLHSDVLGPNENVYNVKSSKVFSQYFRKPVKFDYIISPDKGAKLRALEWASDLDTPLLVCSKVRDPETGRLSSPTVPDADLAGKSVMIVDDICDGGFTFEQLGQVLKTKGCKHISLWVSHGIFSKGIDAMPSIDHIYTTDSLLQATKISHKKLTTLELGTFWYDL